jgi:hypothetical protein
VLASFGAGLIEAPLITNNHRVLKRMTSNYPSYDFCIPDGAVMFANPVPFATPRFQQNPPRALWAFILTLIAGILIILNAAALLSNGFFVMLSGVFFWLPIFDPSATHAYAFVLGAIIGLILIIGSILMLLGYGTIGSIVVFPLAVLSLLIGGGFVAGFVLGVLGGILGMLGR